MRMRHKQTILILSGMLAVSQIVAQEDSGETLNTCSVKPIYHCAEPMDDGSYIGHFGYRVLCPKSDKPVEDVFIDIGDDNYFTPGAIDRGQPKIFLPGEHVDEFEVEFTVKEISKAKEFGWTVRKIGIRVDLSKTEDALLDCKKLPY